MVSDVLRVRDLDREAIATFLARFGLSAGWIGDGQPVTASFWGDAEAGIAGHSVYLRADTPVHSLLHETCHIICMSEARRDKLDRDAGGDDLEEAAVCYLQILLADHLAGVGRDRQMQDMDTWGYSFRLGSTAQWFAKDAADALEWLQGHGLVDAAAVPTFRLRGASSS